MYTRRNTTRKLNWDYRSPGYYFITVCTKNRMRYFGDITCDGGAQRRTQKFASLRTTVIGDVTRKYWYEIPCHFPFISLDEFVLMPDHLHGILRFNTTIDGELKINRFGPQSKNLASAIRGFKSAVKKFATINNIEFEWQPRYYDHVIRTFKRLNVIRNYIQMNPINWARKYNSSITFDDEGYFL
jgi:putative transposase